MSKIEANQLEELLLQRRMQAPNQAESFYHLLLQSDVYVLSDASEGTQTGHISSDSRAELSLHYWQNSDNHSIIPFFTSKAMLCEAKQEEQGVVLVSAHTLFSLTKGEYLVMNPKSNYETIFEPEQVRKLLNNTDILSLSPRQIQAEQSLLLGQPAIYPKKMVGSLKELLAKHSHVKKAYIAVMHDTAIDLTPHLLVGIDVDGDVNDLFEEVGDAASLNSPKGDPVDLYQLTADKDQLSHYFLTQTHPFYNRSLGNRVKSWFRIGSS